MSVGAPTYGAIPVATNSRRLRTAAAIPMTMQINHAGKKEPNTLTDGAMAQPERGQMTAISIGDVQFFMS